MFLNICLIFKTFNTYLKSLLSIGTYWPSSDSCIGISKPLTGSIKVVVSEEDDVSSEGVGVDSWSFSSFGSSVISIISGLDIGGGDSAFNFFPLICLVFRGDVSKLSKGIACGLERVVRRVQGPRATSSMVSSKVLLLPSFSYYKKKPDYVNKKLLE